MLAAEVRLGADNKIRRPGHAIIMLQSMQSHHG